MYKRFFTSESVTEGQVVQLLVRGQLQEPAGVRFVHFPVAEECPDVLVGGVLDAAVLQVAVELGLVDRIGRADAHGHGDRKSVV